MAKIVDVVAGALLRDNIVLLASRPGAKSYPGYWEFPGGKIEIRESIVDALIRELREELNIEVAINDCEILTHIIQEYADKTIKLNVVVVRKWQGKITPLEGQELYYHNLADTCDKEPLLPTTQTILNLLQSVK